MKFHWAGHNLANLATIGLYNNANKTQMAHRTEYTVKIQNKKTPKSTNSDFTVGTVILQKSVRRTRGHGRTWNVPVQTQVKLLHHHKINYKILNLKKKPKKTVITSLYARVKKEAKRAARAKTKHSHCCCLQYTLH